MIDVSDRKQLFLDDDYLLDINFTRGIRKVMHQPVKYEGNPVMKADKPWESRHIFLWGTILQDEESSHYTMWYRVSDGNAFWFAYAVSEDLVKWEKPALGIVEFEGSKKNNLLMQIRGSAGPSVILNPYKKESDKKYLVLYKESGLCIAYSPDGIHWTPYQGNPVYFDTRGFDAFNVFFFDDRLDKYVSYLRRKDKREEGMSRSRYIGRLESEDALRWSVPEVVLGPDDRDPPQSDLYTPAAFKYSEAANAYFMMPSYFDWRRDQLWIQLATSRDGFHWRRSGNREPFIPLGPPGSFESERIYMGCPPLIKGDEIIFYYHGFDVGHDRVKVRGYDYDGAVGIASLRLDGFISLQAGYHVGEVATRPIHFKGSSLELNVDDPDGDVRVEILDDKGEVISGFSRDDCDKITADDVRHQVTWRGKDDVSPLSAKIIQLRFYLQFAKIYAFQFK